MARNPAADWFQIATNAWLLGAEANSVIWMRSLRLMSGGAVAQSEALRMVTEKLEANADLAFKLATGGGATPEAAARRSIRHYRTRVRANRRRLGR